MDDLETIIAKAMQTTQTLQAMHARKQTAEAAPRPASLTVEDAAMKMRCIPQRFRHVVAMMLGDGVPQAIRDLVVALDDTSGTAVPFLTIVGKTGAGKTSTAFAIIVAQAVINDSASPWRFVHADDICTARRSSKLGDEPKAIEDAMTSKPLIIDDVIGQKDQDGDLYRVLRHREENGYQTIITSGLTPNAIETAYGPQFSRRMFSGYTKIIERKP